MNSDQSEYSYLPRPDLTEAAFRRYEVDIARACGGTVTITPQGRSVRTYVTRFRDAVLAYKRFGYTSDYIPAGYDLSRIKAKPRSDGRVDLVNSFEDERRTAKQVQAQATLGVPAGNAPTALTCRAADHDAVIALLQTEPPDAYITYDTEDELKWLWSLRDLKAPYEDWHRRIVWDVDKKRKVAVPMF